MKISIIGLGLIGGSIGRATLAKTDHTVFGYDIDELVITKALMMNAIHQKGDDKTLAESDLVIIALTPQLTIEKMEEILPKLKKDAILMDCCGTKRVIVDKMRELQEQYPDINFVGVHPMAGREFSVDCLPLAVKMMWLRRLAKRKQASLLCNWGVLPNWIRPSFTNVLMLWIRVLQRLWF